MLWPRLPTLEQDSNLYQQHVPRHACRTGPSHPNSVPGTARTAKSLPLLFEPVDLRWGVETTSLAEIEQKNILILRICAEEIERCRPLQIVLIGQRYGSIPPDNLIREAAERAGIEEDLSGCSVTAFEVEIGLRGPGAAAQRCYADYREAAGSGRSCQPTRRPCCRTPIRSSSKNWPN